MDNHIIMRVKSLLDRPLESYPLPATLLDTYIIMNLKIEHAPTKQLLDEREELERSLRRILHKVSNKERLVELVKELIVFHRDMWNLENVVRDPSVSLEVRKEYAYEADKKNDKRAELKTEINALFGFQPGSEVKVRQ